jgi:Tol biopolymer transport system component
MMMTNCDDSSITDWMASTTSRGRPEALDAALAKAHEQSQRPAWAVSLGGGTIGGSRREAALRFSVFGAAALLVVGLVTGGLAAGGFLTVRPPAQAAPSAAIVAPSRSPAASTTASGVPAATSGPSISTEPSPSSAASTGLVAYTVDDCKPGLTPDRCTVTQWLAEADGTNARPIPGTRVIGWSVDGSRLLLQNDVRSKTTLLLADATGTVSKTLKVPCFDDSMNGWDAGDGLLICTGRDEFALSPDGTKVAFVRTDPNVDRKAVSRMSTVIAILDLATDSTTELASTRTMNRATDPCTAGSACQGYDGSPRWSPDGSSIAFERQAMAPEPGATLPGDAVFVVNADGTGLRRVTPASVMAIGPSWSPDGTRLAFTESNPGGASATDFKADIDTINLDGTGLARLTRDGASHSPDWTSGGRLVFLRLSGSQNDAYVMDADGGGVTQIDGSLSALADLGCTACVYLAKQPIENGLPPRAYWQPTP